jgi:site-specific recombinase XerD
LLWRAGLRVNEACNVRCQDFEPQRDGSLRLHIVVAKGGNQRFNGIGLKYSKVIKAHMKGRKSGPLLSTSTGKPITTHQARRTINLLGQRSRVKGRFHPHALRHSYARDLHDEGYSVRDIQKALGHKNLNTTQVYLEDLGIEAVVNKLTTRD